MKLGSAKYLIGEGVKSTWKNRLMSLASIGVLVACMVIIGLALLISENVNKALGTLEQQNVVMVYLKDYNWALYDDTKDTSSQTSSNVTSSSAAASGSSASASSSEEESEKADANGIKPSDYIIHNEKEAEKVMEEITKLQNVEEATIVTPEEALEQIKASMLDGQDKYFTFLDEEYGNPMSIAIKVKMKDMALFGETLDDIREINAVDAITAQDDLADKISAIKDGIGVAGVWIIAILIIIALVIVSNTIRVTMYNRKLEISIMKAVGATNTFIRIPFVVEGILIGLISALISEGLLYFCYRVATETIISTLNTTDIVKYSDMAWLLLLVFIGIGVLAGILGSVIIIRKYLRREGSEFSAI